jgi:hypothetical protein
MEDSPLEVAPDSGLGDYEDDDDAAFLVDTDQVEALTVAGLRVSAMLRVAGANNSLGVYLDAGEKKFWDKTLMAVNAMAEAKNLGLNFEITPLGEGRSHGKQASFAIGGGGKIANPARGKGAFGSVYASAWLEIGTNGMITVHARISSDGDEMPPPVEKEFHFRAGGYMVGPESVVHTLREAWNDWLAAYDRNQ